MDGVEEMEMKIVRWKKGENIGGAFGLHPPGDLYVGEEVSSGGRLYKVSVTFYEGERCEAHLYPI